MQLVGFERLASHADVLRRGAQPSSTRPAFAEEHLEAIPDDPAFFLAGED